MIRVDKKIELARKRREIGRIATGNALAIVPGADGMPTAAPQPLQRAQSVAHLDDGGGDEGKSRAARTSS